MLGKIAQEEKIEVDDGEIDAEIKNMTKDATENREEVQKLLSSPENRESVKRLLMTRKTIQRLVEIAKGSNIKSGIIRDGGERK
ncbi:Trigger factor [subsurface metagenome]